MTTTRPDPLLRPAPLAGALLSAALPLTAAAAHADPTTPLAPTVLVLALLAPVALLARGWADSVGAGAAVGRALGAVLAAQVSGLVAGGALGLVLAAGGADPVLPAGVLALLVPGVVLARLAGWWEDGVSGCAAGPRTPSRARARTAPPRRTAGSARGGWGPARGRR
ncbi:hypothetical protein [Rhodococcus aerolatus]